MTIRRMFQRRGTASEWSTANPVLGEGEVGVELGAVIRIKIGDGTTTWNSLPYAAIPASAATTIGLAILAAADAAAVRTEIGAEAAANKGQPNGYAGLDGSGSVSAAQLPSYVDDVLEYANLAAFPGTGTTGKIYVTLDTNKTYRWSGSAYIEISPSPGSTDSVTEGSVNLYYTNARADARVPAATHAATSKSTPVDADEIPLADSEASFGLKKLTWANMKAALKSYYDSVATTLTNKTISGASNTFSNIPESAVTNLTSDLAAKVAWSDAPAFSRQVAITQIGSTGTEDGNNTWAKLATWTPSSSYLEANLILAVAETSSGYQDTALIAVNFRSWGSGENPTCGVALLAKSGTAEMISPDAFKVISGGWNTPMELWMRKNGFYGQYYVRELAAAVNGGSLVYNNNAAWQSTAPVGAVNNVSSNGVTAFGKRLATIEDLGEQTELTASVATLPRHLAALTVPAWALFSGGMRLTYVTPKKSRTISNLVLPISTAGGAATLARMAVFSVDSSGNLTELAATTNDTALVSSTSTKTKALNTGVNLVAGNTYAFGLLIVTSNAMPELRGIVTDEDELALAPRMTGYVDSLSDIPSSVDNWNVWNGSAAIYMRGT